MLQPFHHDPRTLWNPAAENGNQRQAIGAGVTGQT